LADFFSSGHLKRVGKQPVTPVTQGHPRVNNNPAVFGLNHTGEASNPQRFSTQYGDFHCGSGDRSYNWFQVKHGVSSKESNPLSWL
jgi:hypothetical protein